MEAIFPYVGGKNRMTKKLIPLIPDHTCYVEPFGGGASLLLAKPKSTTEVYNDIDNALADFFSLLQRPAHFERFHEKLQVTPHSPSKSLKNLKKHGEDRQIQSKESINGMLQLV